jgi:predicted small lipoprotein YifL
VRGARRILASAVVVDALAALAGCGSAGGPPPAAQRDVETELGFDQPALDARLSRAEARVGDCMRAQGFDYVAIDPLAEKAAIMGGGTLREQERQFGYFVSTLWGRGRSRGDPNRSVRAALHPADRAAYDRALGGDDPGATFQDAMDTGDFTRLGGCRRVAIEAVFGGAQVLMAIQGKLDELDERIVSDRRMVRATARWASCMAAAGYRYTDPDAIDTDLLKRMERIVGPLPGKFATGPPPGRRAHAYDRAALKALQHDELAIWRADTGCERRHIAPVEEVVRTEMEARFRRENQTLLRRVKPAR